MKCLRYFGGLATAAIAFAAFAPSAIAQGPLVRYTCQDVGNSAPEPLGDREGHAIQVEQYTCHIDSGPMKGAVSTGTNIWEWDKTNAVLVSGSGVARMGGTILVFKLPEAKLALTMADGKAVGSTGSGRLGTLIGTGVAAGLVGKSSTWEAKSTGPGQFEIEEKMD